MRARSPCSTAPPGPAGSGRQRYGAAMCLRQNGLLSDAALEVYRICAARDHEDPDPLLIQYGQSTMPQNATPSAAYILTLLDESDRYLASLHGPGIGEVRAGLAQWRHGPVMPDPRPNAVIDAHLPAALASLTRSHPALTAAIRAAAPHLGWITYDGYPPDQIGPDFGHNHAYVSLIGSAGHLPAPDFDFGLFLIAPHILYRDHHHAAPELYAPLTGPHGWRFRPGGPFTLKPAHVPVWNPPDQPHLTKVGPTPFLCLFGWTRDAESPARVIPASDWATLEALRLEDACHPT